MAFAGTYPWSQLGDLLELPPRYQGRDRELSLGGGSSSLLTNEILLGSLYFLDDMALKLLLSIGIDWDTVL